MKQLITLFAFVACTFTAQATIHIVTCQNGTNHFLPVTVNAMVGDTIHWTWVSGNHIVGVINQSDIPALATSWYAPITSTNLNYEYVVTQPGNYHYVCHPNNPHDEDGYIVVALNTSVPQADAVSSATLYPNPFSDQLTLEATGANSMTIHNLLGEEVAAFTISPGRNVLRTDLATLPKGVYLFSILRNGVVTATKRLVKQ